MSFSSMYFPCCKFQVVSLCFIRHKICKLEINTEDEKSKIISMLIKVSKILERLKKCNLAHEMLYSCTFYISDLHFHTILA